MKPNDVRKLGTDEIAKEIEARKKEMLDLRIQAAQGTLASTAKLRTLRREVARLNTIRLEAAAGLARPAGGKQ